ncbi:MAG: cellulase family glycosylhydrolase [Aquabacterium sp.]
MDPRCTKPLKKSLAAVWVVSLLVQGCGGGAGGPEAPTPVGNEVANGLIAQPEGVTSTTTGSTPITGGANTTSGSTTTDTSTTTAPTVESSAAVTFSPTLWTKPVAQTIANFNTLTDKVSNWSYINGNEFPGASGSLAEAVSDQDGTPAARLSYDLGCGATAVTLKTSAACGKYVGMSLRLPTPLDISAADSPVLTFSFRNPQAAVNPFVRVIDGSGQTLQFKAAGRSIQAPGGQTWQKIYVPVGRSTTFFGGANDGVLRAPIKGIFIGVGDFTLQQPPGWIDVDNIEVLKSPTFAFELKTAAPVSHLSAYPTYVGRLAVTTHTSMGLAHDKAKAAGIQIVRRDLLWGSVEVNGRYDFTEANRIASALAAKGMSVLWILRGGHPNYGGGTPATDASRDAFARFAAATAANFRGKNVFGYEIWNEPNGVQFWPNKDPLDYARLLNKTGAAIRTADVGAKVISGGTAGLDTNYSIQLAGATNPSAIDAFAVHPYSKATPESLAFGMAPLASIVNSQGLNKPIWNTEWGFSSYGDFDAAVYGDGYSAKARARQAVLVLRKVLTQLALDVPFIAIHSLVDYGSDPIHRETNFGLLANDGSDKPAMSAIRTLYSAQSGRAFKGALADVPPGLHVVKWESESDSVYAVWTENVNVENYKVRIPATANSLKRWDGTSPVSTLNGGYYELALAERDGPLWVRIPK